MSKPVRAFITYSWEDEDHKNWVKQFANALLNEGIEAVLDQYDLNPGDRLPHFMEQSVIGSVYVLIICTPKYKEKADARLGGVGYECNLAAGELYAIGNERKYIPILRRGTMKDAIPVFLIGKYAINLSEEQEEYKYEQEFHKLVSTLRGEREEKPKVKTTIGNRAGDSCR